MTNNKQQTNAYLTFFLSLIFIYLIISFGVWDLNASHWDRELRIGYSFFSPLIAMFCVAYTKNK